MAAAAVGEDFDTIQAHADMRTIQNCIIPLDSKNMDSCHAMLYLCGVNNSSHVSHPIQVSRVLMTASPKGTVIYSYVSLIQLRRMAATRLTCPVIAWIMRGR